MSNWDAVALDPADNVGVALRDLAPGAARLRRAGKVETAAVAEPIALGHKFALGPLAPGALVLKYGHPIGEATAPIAAGAHVHVHNIKSRRARTA